MIDLNELKKLAEAATPGPWERDTIRSDGEYGTDDDGGFGFDTYEITDNTGQCIMDCTNNDNGCVEVGHDGHAWDEVAKHNAAFVAAANPVVILELIALASATQDSAPAELPPLPLPDTHCFDEDTNKDVWSHSTEQMREYGRQCAEAARQSLMQLFLDPENQPTQYGTVLAAQQPAPVAIKTWQERLREKFPETAERNLFAVGHLEHAMEAEIADLRAALAAAPASPQPVAKVLADEDKWHSLTCDGTCSPPCKDAPLPPAVEMGGLSDDQLDCIARAYFADEHGQTKAKGAIHDALKMLRATTIIAASTPTTLTEKKE